MGLAGARWAYSIREVSHRLGVGRQTVDRWIATDTLPSIRVKGRRLIPTWALEELLHCPNPLESQQPPPTPTSNRPRRTK